MKYKTEIISIIIGLIFLLIIMPMINGEVQTLGTFKQNDCISLIQTCGTCSYNNITSITSPNSTILLTEISMSKTGTQYIYNFCNTNQLGSYIVNGVGDLDGIPTVWAYDFKITPNGEEVVTGKIILYFGLMFILLIFFLLCIYSFFNYNNLNNRVGMIGLGYLLLIAITFICFNLSSELLTSTPFITSMFRILFIVLMVGLLPLFLGGFVFYIFALIKIKEIQDLMNKGISFEESERRTGRKYK